MQTESSNGPHGFDVGVVRAMLDAAGVVLDSDAEYEEVAVRLAVLLELVQPLMNALRHEPEALMPREFPAVPDRL